MSIHELDVGKNESFLEFLVRFGGVEIFLTNITASTWIKMTQDVGIPDESFSFPSKLD